MKAEYRNSIRSKAMIKEALIKLLGAQQDLSQISVSDIVKVANINRGTFYNHYNNIIDVIEEMETELFTELITRLTENPPQKDVNKSISSLLDYFKKEEKNYKIIIKGLSKTVLDNMIWKLVSQIKSVSPDVDEIMLLFVINGLTGIYFNYLEGRLNMSLNELCEKAVNMINKIVV